MASSHSDFVILMVTTCLIYQNKVNYMLQIYTSTVHSYLPDMPSFVTCRSYIRFSNVPLLTKRQIKHFLVWPYLYTLKENINIILTLPLLDRPKPVPLLLYCLTLNNFTQQGRTSGWESVNTVLTGNSHRSISLKRTDKLLGHRGMDSRKHQR